MKNLTGSFIVSYDFSNKDTGIMVVGKQNKGKMDIVHALQNEEAKQVFRKLSGSEIKNGGDLNVD